MGILRSLYMTYLYWGTSIELQQIEGSRPIETTAFAIAWNHPVFLHLPPLPDRPRGFWHPYPTITSYEREGAYAKIVIFGTGSVCLGGFRLYHPKFEPHV